MTIGELKAAIAAMPSDLPDDTYIHVWIDDADYSMILTSVQLVKNGDNVVTSYGHELVMGLEPFVVSFECRELNENERQLADDVAKSVLREHKQHN